VRSGARLTVSEAEFRFRPARVLEIDLTRPLPDLSRRSDNGRVHERAQVLVRLGTEPLGLLEVELHSDGPLREDFALALWSRFGDDVRRRFRAAGVAAPTDLAGDGLRLPSEWPFLAERERILASAPGISVILCTRDRAGELDRCLRGLQHQAYPNFEIVVVDNAPSTGETAELVASRSARDQRVRYIVEPRPGLSWARNCGIRAAAGEIVAYLDDDETADAHWLAELARGFSAGAFVGCVGGLVLPAELETQAQDWFEQFGGHSKGRGFAPASFDATTRALQSPLYPLPPFAVGANMAFTRQALEEIKGFDPALGAGTLTHACEDTAAFTDVLLAGHTIIYQPTALLWHRHRADYLALRTQLYGYGTGLTAFYTRLLLSRADLTGALLRLLPHAAWDVLSEGSIRTATMRDFPPHLTAAQRRGMLEGPIAYVRARRRARHLARSRAGLLARKPPR
jgi:glycosyltransferase involved in cell wall biosynthesis